MPIFARLTLSLAVLCGCHPTSKDSVPTDSEPTADSAADTDADTGSPQPCVVPDDPAAVFGEVLVEPSEAYPTVSTVRWTPTLEGESWVSFGRPSDAPWSATAFDDDTGGKQATLLGMKASTEYRYQVVVRTDDGTLCTEPTSLTTGALDPGLPSLTLDGDSPDLASGDFTLLPLCDQGGSGGCWTLILDGDADVVWAHPEGPLRAWLSLDGRAVLLNDHIYNPDHEGTIRRVPLDGGEATELSFLGAHTDFVEVEPGVYATFGWDLREYQGGARTIAGETIVEIAEDREPRVVWSTFDALEPDLAQQHTTDPSWSTPAEIWAHLNHLHYAPDEDAYYATSRNQMAVYRIDRATGETTWTLGQGGGDFQQTGEGQISFNPHSAIPTANGLLLFDTGSGTSGGCSGMSEFALDDPPGAVEHTWLYTTEDCLVTNYMGNAIELEGGNRMMVLAMNAQLHEVTPAGELAWRLQGPFGWLFGYVTRTASLYR